MTVDRNGLKRGEKGEAPEGRITTNSWEVAIPKVK